MSGVISVERRVSVCVWCVREVGCLENLKGSSQNVSEYVSLLSKPVGTHRGERGRAKPGKVVCVGYTDRSGGRGALRGVTRADDGGEGVQCRRKGPVVQTTETPGPRRCRSPEESFETYYRSSSLFPD